MIYLAAVDAIAIAASLAYLIAYGRIADWRDHIAVNAWLGGLAALLLSVSGGLYVAGHYGWIDGYTWPLLVACAGFTVVAAVWAHRVTIVLAHGERPWWRIILGHQQNQTLKR